MVTVIVIGSFVLMLLAPCAIAMRAYQSRTKSESPAQDDSTDALSILEQKPATRVSSSMRTVRIKWQNRFDSDEFPRSPRRIVPRRR